jgi:hypothetical protein
MIQSVNGKVVTSPFPDVGPGIERNGGLIRIAPPRFVKLTVVFACPEMDLRPGDRIFVKAIDGKAAWATEILEYDGVGKVVLVPSTQVILVERETA